MMATISTADLKQVAAFADLPDEHLQWIIDHSVYSEFDDGVQIRKTGDEADVMIIILEGEIAFYLDQHGKLVFYLHFANDTATGGVSGVLPYSRMKIYPGCAFAKGKLRCLMLHRQYFHELEMLNPDLIQRLIGYMTERAKIVATTQLQQEKVSALGQLSAGIAHEMNNPASAINRISGELSKRLQQNYTLTQFLLGNQVAVSAIQQVKEMVEGKPGMEKKSALQRLEMEDELSDWLAQSGINNGQPLSETFIDEGFTISELEQIKNAVTAEAFGPLLQWLDNLLSSRRLLKDLEEASSRISKLVAAIKSHVHMDRTNDLQLTDIHADLDNTLTLLGYKLRDKNIQVIKDLDENLPSIPAYVGELNQVWTNILDNAIFAVEKGGSITIATSHNEKQVCIKIIDSGTGIPPGILSRIFDPFFTTKKMGEGTGIGLDIVHRIVKHHNGDIKVSSVPGQTEFAVTLPISQPIDNQT